jgi:hypothetical protein
MTGRGGHGHGGRARARCPVCGAPSVRDHRPFCSARCAEVDLGRWLKGAYAIAGDPVPEGGPEGETEA